MTRSTILRYRADLRTIAAVTIYGILLVASWWVFPGLSLWQQVLLVAVHCGYQFCISTIIHNVIHVPVFRYKWMNRCFQLYLSCIHGHPVSGFVPGHNLSHHRYVQTAKDITRTTRIRFRWNLMNQVLFFFSLMFEVMASEQRFVKKMWKAKPSWSRQYTLEVVFVFGLKIILLILNWKLAIWLLLFPNFYATWGIFAANYWQHDGCDHEHEFNHSRNFTGGVFNWLTFNNGFHGIHHMYPVVHWSLYPNYHAEKLGPYCHPNLNQSNSIVYLWKSLIYPGKRLDYLGNPVKLGEKIVSEDWVEDVKRDKETDLALGAIQ